MDNNQINVLLIEDNAGDAKLVKELLCSSRNLNFNITHVDRLSKGILTLEEKKIDVTLLDLAIPDCIGLSTFSKVKIIAPHVPIIILTGCTLRRPFLNHCLESTDEFLLKENIDSKLLTNTIFNVIKKQKTHLRLQKHFVSVEK